MADLTVRHLETGDIFRAAKIIAKISKPAKSALLIQQQTDYGDDGKPLPPDPEAVKARNIEFGFALFEAAVEHCEQDLRAFFASLVNMKPADFDRTPVDTVFIILERLMETEDVAGFLSRASGLAKKSFTRS